MAILSRDETDGESNGDRVLTERKAEVMTEKSVRASRALPPLPMTGFVGPSPTRGTRIEDDGGEWRESHDCLSGKIRYAVWNKRAIAPGGRKVRGRD